AVGLDRVRARAGRRVTRAGVVALVLGRAGDRVAPRAGPALARVALGAGVAVVARRPVSLRRIRAHPRCRVARPRLVALVLSRARDRVASHAGPALARVALGAGTPLAARRAVGLGWVRARPRCRVTRPRRVTLVGGRAGDGIAPGAGPALAGVGLR